MPTDTNKTVVEAAAKKAASSSPPPLKRVVESADVEATKTAEPTEPAKTAESTEPAKTAEPTESTKLDPHEEARNRAAACGRAVGEVLRQHRCRIVPYLQAPEPVGVNGSKVILTADYGIIPNMP